MDNVNIIWISFLSILVIFFVLYSIFSKSVEVEENEDGSIYDNFKSKSKPRSKQIEPKKDTPKTLKGNSKLKKRVDKASNKKDKVKVKELIRKGSTPEEIKDVIKPKPKLKKTEGKPKPKSNIKSKPKQVETSEPKKDTPKKDVKIKPNPKQKQKDGLEFKGQFDDKEVEFLKKYAHRNRGFVTQKLNDKVTAKKWLKTKRSYDMLMTEINNKKDSKGSYKTYVIWNNKVDKYLLKSKIK